MTTPETITQWLSSTLNWCKENCDTTLILAVATETPRWTVVFTALHEPALIGVAMGVLISWAAKKGWNAWTHDRNRYGLFALNIWVLVSAIAIMSPVLLEMTQHPIEDVNVRNALDAVHPYAQWFWVVLVAQSTFMPLIQAVVAQPHASKVPAMQPVQETDVPVAQSSTPTPIAIEMQSSAAQEDALVQEYAPVQDATITTNAKELYLQLRASGRKHTELVRELGVKGSTAMSWWNRSRKMQMQGGD